MLTVYGKRRNGLTWKNETQGIASRVVNAVTFEATVGDITSQDVDAIVNAANSSLLGGGGVDGAIHRRAGPQLLLECATLNGCNTGDAKITRGYQLIARHVIHTVGPVFRDGHHLEPFLLAGAYHRSLEVASENELISIAFPAISTGAYGYPMNSAAEIAVGTCMAFVLSRKTSIALVRFVLFSEAAFGVYAQKLAQQQL